MSRTGAQHFLAQGGGAPNGIVSSNFEAPNPASPHARVALDMHQGQSGISQDDAAGQVKRLIAEARKLIISRELQAAVPLVQQAIQIEPRNAELHFMLGETLELMMRPEMAILSHLEALKLDPGNAQYQCNIGTYLMRLNREQEAIGFFELAAQTDPKNAIALVRMIFLKLRHADWSAFKNLSKTLKVIKNSASNVDPFAMLPVTDDPEFQKSCSVKVARAAKASLQDEPFVRPQRQPGKIRLGYFSSDFHDHATMFLIGRLFELHDRGRFEVILYDYGKATHEAGRLRAERAADVYRHVADKTYAEIVETARADELDITIDLKGYTRGNKVNVFQSRLAPVQVAYLGYPGTTGIQAMDYMVADQVTIPANLRKHYTEKIIYMPDCYQVNDNTRQAASHVPSRAELGLPEDAFVFCSFNGPYKVSPAEFDIWMNLLHSVPGSVLWFYANQETVRTAIAKEADQRGIAAERIVFADTLPQAEHLARLRHADLFLDTFNVNAHTTASDALWAGVPVVTKAGKQFAARVAASLLHAVGLDDLAAATPQQYEALALKLARDPAYLAEVKARLKDGIQSGPLYDTESFTRSFEALMEKALERSEAGLKPDHISLA